MSKEEDLKRVDLKVSVNCCDGCKRKVLKALSIKGVLKTEIHPTLPKITVTGDVDVQTLIRKLAKRGKKAELWPSHPKPEKQAQMPESIDKETESSGEKTREDDHRKVSGSRDTDTSDEKKVEKAGGDDHRKVSRSRDTDTRDKKKVEKAGGDDHRKVSRSRDTDTRDKKKVEKAGGDDHRKVSGSRDTDTCGEVEKMDHREEGNSTSNGAIPSDTISSSYQTVINCVANPNMMPPSRAQAYYQMEPCAVPMNAYSVQPPPPCYYQHQHQYQYQHLPVYHQYPAPVQSQQQVTPPPCCNQYPLQAYYESPIYHQNHHHSAAPVQSQQPTAFTDYFNDDNTLGCYVM